MNDWDDLAFDTILDKIRSNCVLLSTHHKKNYDALYSAQKPIRLAVICISGVNSILSIGMNSVITNQKITSITNCLLSLFVSILGSIQLYLKIEDRMNKEYKASQDFYILSINIYKVLSLGKEYRPIPAKDFLNDCFKQYIKLTEDSEIIKLKLNDNLAPIEINSTPSTPRLQPSASSSNMFNV
jgi:hypothetical protein